MKTEKYVGIILGYLHLPETHTQDQYIELSGAYVYHLSTWMKFSAESRSAVSYLGARPTI